MKRRIWGILIISLLLLLGFGTATMSFAANNQGTPGLQYEVIDDDYPYCILTGVGSATEKNIVIPEDWNNLHVRGIAAGAFKDCTFIESVSLPTFVTSIGREAFKGCTNLNNINLRNVLHVEDNCFEGCSSLDNVYLGNVRTIGNYAFSKTGISGKIYLDYCTSLGMGAFDNCWNLEKVSLRSGTQTINDYTFYECRSLKEINLSSSLQSVGNGAFYNCTSLNTDIFNTENNVSSIGDYAFWNCTALDGPLILNNINSLGKYAFCNCSSLEGSLILNNISSIGEYTFCNCSSLDGSLILNNIHSVGEYAFSNCTGFKEVKLAKSLTSCSATAFENLSSVEYLEIGKCIQNFDHESFSKFSSLKTLEVNDSIDTIKDLLVGNKTLETVRIARINGFESGPYDYTDVDVSDCTNLKVFYLNSGGKLHYVFRGCSSLEELYLEEGSLYIDDVSLQDCPKLRKLVMPYSVDLGVHGLRRIPTLGEYVGPGNFFEGFECMQITKATLQGIAFESEGSSLANTFSLRCPFIEELTVNAGVQVLEDASMFDGFNRLRSLTINDVTEVYYGAFRDSSTTLKSSLKYISLPDATTIQIGAFTNCSALETVVIPSIKKIAAYSMDDCEKLKAVVIGASIPNIEQYAFFLSKAVSIYSSLTREEFVQKAGEGYFQDWMPPFYFLGEYDIVDGEYINREKYPIKWFDHKGNLIKTTTVFEGEMPKEIEAPVISGYVFERWTPNLKKVESAQEYRAVMFPDLSYEFSGGECTVKGIGNYTDKELVIPDTYKGCKVTKIAPEAFKGNANLTNITLGQNIKNIDKQAFEGCSSLTSVFIGKNVSSIDEFAFKDCYALETLAVDADNAYYCTEGNVLYDKAKTTLILAADKGVKGIFIIPDTVTSVGEQAIRHCTEITEVIIPDSIKEFKPGSFMDCTSLKRVVFPDTVTKLGSAAFMNCESLEYVDFGKGLKTLPAACCSKCPNLTTVVIGDKISTLYLVPFLECPSLKDIYFTGDEGAWNKLLHTVSPLDTVIKNATVHFGHPDDMQFDGYGSGLVNVGGSSDSNDGSSVDYSDATEDSQRSSSALIIVLCCVAVAIIAGVVIYKKKHGNKTKD